MRCVWLAIGALTCIATSARAHPVPKSNHDRTIIVRLQKSDKPAHLVVRVEYTLEVDETTVLLEDMLPFRDEVDFARYRGRPLDYYREFMRIYAPIIGDRLLVKVDGKKLELTSTDREPRLNDKEKKEPLGHLACDFVFRAEFAVAPDMEARFWFREANYVLQEGQIRLSFVDEAGLKLSSVEAPDDRSRRTCGRSNAIPCAGLVARHKIGHHRKVRQHVRACRCGDRQCAQPAGPDVLDRGSCCIKRNLHLTTDQIAQCRRRPAIGHVSHRGVGHHLEQLARDVVRSSTAG